MKWHERYTSEPSNYITGWLQKLSDAGVPCENIKLVNTNGSSGVTVYYYHTSQVL